MVFLATANAGAGLGSFLIPIGFLVFFYVFAIRPQKKREKEIRAMRESLRVGDEVVTIGGLYGKIIRLKEDIVTIEVGANKTKIDVTRWAIGTVANNKESKENKENKEDKE